MGLQRREEEVSDLRLNKGVVDRAGAYGAPDLLSAFTANHEGTTRSPATEVLALLLARRGERLIQQRQQVACELSLTANRGLGTVAQSVVCCR